ncbi:hypothetical protein PsYK624_152420 [Phanerochaete sordida]|uniref:DUF6593 domain-containing protein n=1 Tax=Phanerochaete sordida TaxID=48140 RepID=A0A9P3GT23_9APHY|nr:hypothetical protein PsYK624_152420 [Phanerochaete sordida]
MLLLPSASDSDSRPLYHISVELSCFSPASHITVVRRGSSENGLYVGEFQVGGPARLNRVIIGSVAHMLRRPLLAWDHNPARSELPRLRWNFDGTILRWDPVVTTVQGKSRTFFKCLCPDPVKKKVLLPIATFNPADPLLATEGSRPMATLTVEKEGHSILDHILITALMLQQDTSESPAGSL